MEDKSFSERKFIKYIDDLIVNKKYSHAYLIEISDYDREFKYVLDFVKMIVCNVSYSELRKNNSVFNMIDSNNYPDLVILEPIGNFIKKEQLLDLQKEFNNKSLLNSKRVYIIKNAEKLNVSSANTILKFLEEPESDIVAILVAKNRFQVLDTILSRCQILSLKNEYFDIKIDDNLLNFLSLLRKPQYLFVNYNIIFNNYFPDKNICINFFNSIELILIKYLESLNNNDVFIENEIEEILKNYSTDLILKYLLIIENEISKLEYNVNFKLWIDALFSRFIMEGEYND